MVERLNGTVSERNKVMRGLKEKETASMIMDGQRIYYNFIRLHMALNGETPAENAKLNINLGRIRWRSLVLKSAKSK